MKTKFIKYAKIISITALFCSISFCGCSKNKLIKTTIGTNNFYYNKNISNSKINYDHINIIKDGDILDYGKSIDYSKSFEYLSIENLDFIHSTSNLKDEIAYSTDGINYEVLDLYQFLPVSVDNINSLHIDNLYNNDELLFIKVFYDNNNYIIKIPYTSTQTNTSLLTSFGESFIIDNNIENIIPVSIVSKKSNKTYFIGFSKDNKNYYNKVYKSTNFENWKEISSPNLESSKINYIYLINHKNGILFNKSPKPVFLLLSENKIYYTYDFENIITLDDIPNISNDCTLSCFSNGNIYYFCCSSKDKYTLYETTDLSIGLNLLGTYNKSTSSFIMQGNKMYISSIENNQVNITIYNKDNIENSIILSTEVSTPQNCQFTFSNIYDNIKFNYFPNINSSLIIYSISGKDNQNLYYYTSNKFKDTNVLNMSKLIRDIDLRYSNYLSANNLNNKMEQNEYLNYLIGQMKFLSEFNSKIKFYLSGNTNIVYYVDFENKNN